MQAIAAEEAIASAPETLLREDDMDSSCAVPSCLLWVCGPTKTRRIRLVLSAHACIVMREIAGQSYDEGVARPEEMEAVPPSLA